MSVVFVVCKKLAGYSGWVSLLPIKLNVCIVISGRSGFSFPIFHDVTIYHVSSNSARADFMRLHKSTFLLLSLILTNMSWSQDQPGRLLRSMVDFPRHFDVEPIQTSPEQPTSSQLPTREEVANSYIIEIPNVVPQSSEHTNGRFRESSLSLIHI